MEDVGDLVARAVLLDREIEGPSELPEDLRPAATLKRWCATSCSKFTVKRSSNSTAASPVASANVSVISSMAPWKRSITATTSVRRHVETKTASWMLRWLTNVRNILAHSCSGTVARSKRSREACSWSMPTEISATAPPSFL